jgi:rSAM/selenodomain-associated transferase 1
MQSSEIVLQPRQIERTLVVMAKAPRPGTVKTRLAQGLGTGAVTELYRCMLDDTMTLARSLPGIRVAIMTPVSDVREMEQFAGSGTKVVGQQGVGLAAALTSVFAKFATCGMQHVIAFNSDSPHLPNSVIASAFDILMTHDLVVGPTHDGGYYLVGAKASHPALFESDGMGTASALDALLARARGRQLSVGFTDQFYDIDVQDDLSRLVADLRSAPERAPRTAGWLNARRQELSQLRSAAGEL